MPLEYEYKISNYDKKLILDKIIQLNGKKMGHFIFKVMVFSHPRKKKKTYIRIRDEGHRITMTYKNYAGSKFASESEVIINDFEMGKNILLGLGCISRYYYEKIREIWHIGNTEICFDTLPGKPEFMEIESATKKELDEMVKTLNLVDKIDTNNNVLYDKFGLVLDKGVSVIFDNIDILAKYVTKNIDQFKILIEQQKKLYDSVKNGKQ